MRKKLLLWQFQDMKLQKQHFPESKKFHFKTWKISLNTTLNLLHFFFLFSFYFLRMSEANVFTLLFLSENLFCRKSQNIKVWKKPFAVSIPEYKIGKTKFCQQPKISLKCSKNSFKDNINFFGFFFWIFHFFFILYS